MAERSKIAFGSSDRIQAGLDAGVIDACDLLLLDGDTDSPKIGWIGKDGNPVIVTDEKADLSQVEADLAEVNAEVDTLSASVASHITESNAAFEATNAEVAKKIDTSEAKVSYEKVKYEIFGTPIGTLVDYREKEIRVMIPSTTEFKLQNSGVGSLPNLYYIGFRAYAPENAHSYKEPAFDDNTYYFEDNAFAGIDKYDRKYAVTWWSVASYDETTGEWTYYGAESTTDNYFEKKYFVEWYDESGLLIASDNIKVTLSNEDCHGDIKPHYINEVIAEMKEYCDDVAANAQIAVVEF